MQVLFVSTHGQTVVIFAQSDVEFNSKQSHKEITVSQKHRPK